MDSVKLQGNMFKYMQFILNKKIKTKKIYMKNSYRHQVIRHHQHLGKGFQSTKSSPNRVGS